MNIELNENQVEIQKLAKDFAQKEIAPKIKNYDENQEFPHEIINKLGEMGFLGIIFPPE